MSRPRHLALYIESLGTGGIERVYVTLANAFVRRGHRVDLLVRDTNGAFAADLDPAVRLVLLQPSARYPPLRRLLPKLRTFQFLWPLVQYLRHEQPEALVPALVRRNLVALCSVALARSRTRVVVTEHSHTSAEIATDKTRRAHLKPFLMRLLYTRAHAVVGVSRGVSEDLEKMLRWPEGSVRTIYNPVDLEAIEQQAGRTEDWQIPAHLPRPYILSMGRLAPEKDFETLLRAFRRVLDVRPASLLLLGDGPERAHLEALSHQLGLTDHVYMPGFVRNPHAYLRRAEVFAMSSVREGFPMVLIEALAAGTNIVSTDCASGPREVLDGGRYGRLVPMQDPAALADGLLETLAHPLERDALTARAQQYSAASVADQYLEVMFSVEPPNRSPVFALLS